MANYDVMAVPSVEDAPNYKEALALEWTLSIEDIRFILKSAKGDQPLLYFALQLKSLHNTGIFLEADAPVSNKVITYLCKQLDIPTTTSLMSVSRNTQSTYYQKITVYLDYHDYADAVSPLLKNHIQQGVDSGLFSTEALKTKAYAWLKSHKILPPDSGVLARLIASYKKASLDALYARLANKLSSDQKENMLSLLKRQPHLLSELYYYKKSPPEPTADKMNLFLQRFNELKALGITAIDCSDISEVVFNKLDVLGRTYDANTLRRIRSDNKALALLLCVLFSASQQLLDHILAMNDHMLMKKERISRNKFDKTLKGINRKAKKSLQFLVKITKTWLHHSDPENTTLSDFKKQLDQEKLTEALATCEQMSDYQATGYYQILEGKYHDLRKYTVPFFDLDFKGAAGTESIFRAIQILRDLNHHKIDTLPKEVPMHFIPKKWRDGMRKDGVISRRTWEMALYYTVKKNIAMGDIYCNHSKKHRYFWNTVYNESAWEKEKPTAFKTLALPEKFADMLSILKKEYQAGINLAKQHLSEGTFAYVGLNGQLKLRKEDALEIPESVRKLKSMIEARLPVVRIETVLTEIDNDIHFSRFFVPPEGFDQKAQVDQKELYATLVAHGTNLGLVDMANSTLGGITLERLKRIAQWGIRPDVITEANHFLVKTHSEHPLSKIYGDFTGSGSDGDRFCIQKSTNLASFYPKAFGYYQKVISIYTHLSDQHSVFSTQVISCGVREASYVLDGLLQSKMVNDAHFHCTDTGGFTHHLFALCYLLGFSFQPRLKDLADQTLYKLDKQETHGKIDTLFKGHIDLNCISEQWEPLVRIVSSLKNQVAPAHMVLQKLAARSASDRVAKALLELGKLIKTIYILHYLSAPELRRKVQLQLNRGESRHYLARHIFFANQGEFKTGDYEEIMNIASCLSLLSNAVLLWNTRKIYGIVEELRKSGVLVDDEDLKRVSPLQFKHLIVHGTYDFRQRSSLGNYASN